MTRKATPDILSPLLHADERIYRIPIACLHDNPFQRRSTGMTDDDGLMELTDSVRQNGVLQPLVVREHPTITGYWQIAAGHRRRRAAELAGLTDVPCVVRSLDDAEMLTVVVVENYHRKDISAIDRAHLFGLLAKQGLSHQEIADRFSVSRPAVSNALRLLQLPGAIQADVVAGRISNRQAEALLPLATLPAEAQQALNRYSDLAAMVEEARNGSSSDRLRDLVQASVLRATKVLPDHWKGYDFQDLAGAIQPRCAGCSYIRTVEGEESCTMPPCWHIKSGAWQAIENSEIVALTGVPILSQSGDVNRDSDYFYGDARRLLNIPDIAAGPPAHQCPNIRVRKDYNDNWSFCCHYGASGSKECTCLAKARKSADADSKRILKQLVSDTEATLKPHLANFCLDALRLLASKYGKWEQRNQVATWDAERCTTVIAGGLIKDRLPYDAAQNMTSARVSMEQLLNIAGLRAPWLPPLEQEIAEQLAAIRTWLDDFLDPGDGTPTPDAIAATINQLGTLADTIRHRVSEPQRKRLSQQQSGLWLEAIALQDRVLANYETTLEE